MGRMCGRDTLFCARARETDNRAAVALLACAGALLLTLLPLLAMGGGDDEKYAALVAQLKSPDLAARVEAERKLAAGGAPAVKAMAKAGMGDPRSRGWMMARLARMGPPAMKALVGLLSDPELRDFAGDTLARAIRQDAWDLVPDLLSCMKDPAVKTYCGQAMVRAMCPEARKFVPKLAAALKDQDRDIRMYAVFALGQAQAKAKPAVPALAGALKDPDAGVRAAAARTLGKIGTAASGAAAALEAAGSDPDDEVRQASAKSLKSVRGQDEVLPKGRVQ